MRILLTQEQMANMLAITREYLSKTLKKIRIKKLIKIDKTGRITIPDVKKIEEEMRDKKS